MPDYQGRAEATLRLGPCLKMRFVGIKFLRWAIIFLDWEKDLINTHLLFENVL